MPHNRSVIMLILVALSFCFASGCGIGEHANCNLVSVASVGIVVNPPAWSEIIASNPEKTTFEDFEKSTNIECRLSALVQLLASDSGLNWVCSQIVNHPEKITSVEMNLLYKIASRGSKQFGYGDYVRAQLSDAISQSNHPEAKVYRGLIAYDEENHLLAKKLLLNGAKEWTLSSGVALVMLVEHYNLPRSEAMELGVSMIENADIIVVKMLVGKLETELAESYPYEIVDDMEWKTVARDLLEKWVNIDR